MDAKQRHCKDQSKSSSYCKSVLKRAKLQQTNQSDDKELSTEVPRAAASCPLCKHKSCACDLNY